MAGIGMAVWLAALAHETGPQARAALPFAFSAPPLETFSVPGSFSHSEYDTIRLGQFSRPQGSQLRTVQFNTLAMDHSTTWAPSPTYFPDPLEVRDTLEDIMDAGTPILLLAFDPETGRHELETDGAPGMPATLRSLTIEQRAGEIDCRYLDVSFSEWRRAIARRRTHKRGGQHINVAPKHFTGLPTPDAHSGL